MKILVTGAAGFIGYHTCKLLLSENITIIGLDNINDYYDVNLKYDRLKQLGIHREEAEQYHKLSAGTLPHKKFSFVRMDLQDREALPKLFQSQKFDMVCNLAAQAGVRYSLEEPDVYVDSNIVGFLNILECCRHNKIKHLVYASSSSVYGSNKKVPFSVDDNVDHPISLYAATKKSNELMAHTYSHLFHIPTTGLRFFTVYGPWGRPDMAPFLFTNAISQNRPIKVFNHGKMERDFTYVDDIAQGVVKVLMGSIVSRVRAKEFYKLYNVGNNDSVQLTEFIKELETNLKKKAKKKMMPIQPGDVEKTWANIDALIRDYNYRPETTITEGVKKYVSWYLEYYT